MKIPDKLKRRLARLALSAVVPWLGLGTLYAQQSRINSPISDSQTVVLSGHVNRQAQAPYDQGAVESTFLLPSITIHFKPTAGQQQSLAQLLSNQQNPASPQYHKWLTPEQYADQFGASPADMAKIATWLQSQGFTIQLTARSRTWISFSGTAQQVQSALHTPIHRYNVNGEIHYANAANPALPAAFAGLVSSIRGLNDFRWKPRNVQVVTPKETLSGTHYVVPDDWAAIYDVTPLYNAGINGAGQSLVIVGQTEIIESDITAFRSQFNLPPILLQQVLVPGQQNPGIADFGDLGESDLDIEWSGAVARNATIIFVYSPDVMTSFFYAVDADLAPVISISYGACENSELVDLPSLRSVAQQANAEGITWLAAAGDSGAADCDYSGTAVAQNGLTVDAPGSIPEVTSVGGTEFNEQGGAYWSSTNNANSASALSYIPEMVWNDTSEEQGILAGGGGSSAVFFKPVWQTGPGVPNDGARDVPDIAFNASVAHDPTYVYSLGSGGYAGGTSFGAPTMAGVVTLLNQYLVSSGVQQQPGLANINPTIYRLAQSSSGVFHDVTTGNNSVPCVPGSPNCSSGTLGYNAAPNYDLASGWGSLDVSNFVHQWSSAAATGSAVVVSVTQSPGPEIYGGADVVFEQPAGTWSFALTLTDESAVPTTLTAMSINGADYSPQITGLFGSGSIPANRSISAQIELTNLTAPANVPFALSGVDATGQPWSLQLAVPFEGAQPQLSVVGASNAAGGQLTFAPGEWVAVYGTGLGAFTQSAGALPLTTYLAGFGAAVNGFPAYLLYVSPVQVNLQIPWEIPAGPATLIVGNAYTETTYNFQISSAAPGLFEFTPGVVAAQDANFNNIGPSNPARPGDTVIVYANALGRISNRPLDGFPAVSVPLSKTVSPPTVSIGGQPATVTFSGLTPTEVSLYQLNVVVPLNLAPGNQSIVVTIGGQTSNTSGIMVQ